MEEPSIFDSVPQIVESLQRGLLVVVVDALERENEGDLVAAGELITPEMVNFMITHGRGLVCMPITRERADMLGLKPMVSFNEARFGTPFTQSIGARYGITTGISAQDRAHTIRVAAAHNPSQEDIVCPGHVFPLIAHDGGVLGRPGHTEASIDLMKLARLKPVAVLCEILSQNGMPARLPELKAFARRFNLRIGSISELIAYRTRPEMFHVEHR